ncbi:MAG: hypothetical protein AB7U44_06080 [Sulfuricurvum sp.]|jgi:hypothetical protein|uniref:hypothetical protein n=2 Tax=Sulfuricurvum sp. TaxID=2025608 RepID=UPI00260C82C5|nr:hypothetical protein [Sulfuricurvum sp.]MDD2839197.1 hypothetical protein [Sulfuricurvum sp.]MDD3595014.1 hypothetical protein [Sulfuricurvum sp.]MDD4884756.1 hypothetical protein [Sulfuricurvum sp.]
MMRKILFILLCSTQALQAFWLFDFFKEEPKPIPPPYALEHPMISDTSVFGVGNGKNYLEAKTKALNDIATQLQSDVRSLTSVHKNSESGENQTDQQITLLTKRKLDNFTVIDESHVGETTYLLIEYKKNSN